MTEHQPKILGIIGSLRAQSHTARMVELVLEAAERAGAKTRIWDLRQSPLPLFNPDEEREHPAYLKGREDILWADALLLGSPDYHGSMSGPMKNLLDHYWKEFSGKLFGYVCSSHEKGLTCMDQMRTAVRQCYGWSLPYGIGFNGDADLTPRPAAKPDGGVGVTSPILSGWVPLRTQREAAPPPVGLAPPPCPQASQQAATNASSGGYPASERLRLRIEGYGHDLSRYGALVHGQFLRDRAAQPRSPGFAAEG